MGRLHKDRILSFLKLTKIKNQKEGKNKRNYTQQDVNLHKDTRNDEKLPGTFAMHTEEQLKHNMFKEAVAR